LLCIGHEEDTYTEPVFKRATLVFIQKSWYVSYLLRENTQCTYPM
jgi:hypothetical protein